MGLEVRGLTKFVSHCEKVAIEAKKVDVVVVTELAQQTKAIMQNVAGADVPGRRLSRFARGKGITVSASYRVIPAKPVSAIVSATPPGPWGLLEKGGKAHTISPRGNTNFLGNIATGFAASGPVQHPGSPAKHTFSKAETLAIGRGHKMFQSSVRRTYLKMFSG